MSKKKYKLFLTGEMAEGKSAEEAASRLAKAFKTTPERFSPLLRGEPISKNLSLRPDQAETIETFIKSIGAEGYIAPIEPESNQAAQAPPPPPEPSASSNGSVDLVSMAGFGEEKPDKSQDKDASANFSGGLSLEPAEEKPTGKEEEAVDPNQIQCPKCGHAQAPSDSCEACGIFFAKYEAQQQGGGVSAPLPISSGAHQHKQEDEGSLEGDMLGYVRDNPFYYREKFEQIRAGGGKFMTTWHWPAFFVPVYWALYRKMWAMGIALFVVTMLAWVIPLASLAVHVGFALCANYLYYKHVEGQVGKLRGQGEVSTATLAHSGGTSWIGVILLLIAPILAAPALMAIIIPDEAIEEVQATAEAFNEQNMELMKTQQGSQTFFGMSMAKMLVLRMIKEDKISSGAVNIDDLVDQGIPANQLIDGWGTKFEIEAIGDEITVRSAGPDRAFNTEDDIVR